MMGFRICYPQIWHFGILSYSYFKLKDSEKQWGQEGLPDLHFALEADHKMLRRAIPRGKRYLYLPRGRDAKGTGLATSFTTPSARTLLSCNNFLGPSESESCSVVSDSKTPRTIQSMEFSSQNTGMGSLSLLQGIFPTQGLNPGIPHCRWILYQLRHQGSLQS